MPTLAREATATSASPRAGIRDDGGRGGAAGAGPGGRAGPTGAPPAARSESHPRQRPLGGREAPHVAARRRPRRFRLRPARGDDVTARPAPGGRSAAHTGSLAAPRPGRAPDGPLRDAGRRRRLCPARGPVLPGAEAAHGGASRGPSRAWGRGGTEATARSVSAGLTPSRFLREVSGGGGDGARLPAASTQLPAPRACPARPGTGRGRGAPSPPS